MTGVVKSLLMFSVQKLGAQSVSVCGLTSPALFSLSWVVMILSPSTRGFDLSSSCVALSIMNLRLATLKGIYLLRVTA
jgi:hypothetical protein